MTTLSPETLDVLTQSPPAEAWAKICAELHSLFTAPIPAAIADAETVKRDRAVSDLDLLLSGSVWSLWNVFEEVVPQTSQTLQKFWSQNNDGKAILILDGLSLREWPWFLSEAEKRGYQVRDSRITGSELPGDTTSFAKALGFGQRSKLENNQGKSPHFPNAYTESANAAWQDCIPLIRNQPHLIFWHHWPDQRLHDLSEPGQGLAHLARETRDQICSDDFWGFIEVLTQGRRLVITSDHGYAATGLYSDVHHKKTIEYLKKHFKSQRYRSTSEDEQPQWYPPPLEFALNTRHGRYSFVLGRRKWKVSGGFPTLSHGGLSLLDVMVPWIEITR